ncbi:MAG: PQQ-dependent sugar dehydrogenase [Arachnia sp.]
MHRTHMSLTVAGMAALMVLTACAAPADPTASVSSPSGSAVPSVTATPMPSETGTGTVPADETPPAESPEPTMALISTPQDVSTQLGAPWSVVFHKGVPLVSERDSGRILELSEDGSAREVAVIEASAARGEGGLLGLAVDDQDRLFVYYTASGDNRIARFDVAGDAGALTLGEPTIILQGLNKANTHNGGRIAFGPDGMLYVTTGDAGVPGRAQELGSLSGKILRMTTDGDVPAGNPFEDSLVWTLGHRNVQGMAWSDDGTMFATEFGQNTWDELNIIEAGKNYGWPTVEGQAGESEFVDPVQQWEPSDASPSGMAYLDGSLWIANLRGQVLRSVSVADPTSSTEHWKGEFGRLRDAVVSPEGYLWVVTNNTDGRGRPAADDDKILAISAQALSG